MKKLKNSFQTLAETAKKQINQLEVKKTIKIHSNKINLLIDVSDIKEIKKYRRVLATNIILKYMLEFWTNTNNLYHKKKLNKNINFIFNFVLDFRSTITTLKINDIGLFNISHLISGYKKWLELESAIEDTTSIKKTLYERE